MHPKTTFLIVVPCEKESGFCVSFLFVIDQESMIPFQYTFFDETFELYSVCHTLLHVLGFHLFDS